MEAASPIATPATAISVEIVPFCDSDTILMTYTHSTRIICSASCDIDGIVAFCIP